MCGKKALDDEEGAAWACDDSVTGPLDVQHDLGPKLLCRDGDVGEPMGNMTENPLGAVAEVNQGKGVRGVLFRCDDHDLCKNFDRNSIDRRRHIEGCLCPLRLVEHDEKEERAVETVSDAAYSDLYTYRPTDEATMGVGGPNGNSNA